MKTDCAGAFADVDRLIHTGIRMTARSTFTLFPGSTSKSERSSVVELGMGAPLTLGSNHALAVISTLRWKSLSIKEIGPCSDMRSDEAGDVPKFGGERQRQ